MDTQDNETTIEEIKTSWKSGAIWIGIGILLTIISLGALLPVLLVILLFVWLEVLLTSYTVTNERLIIRKGVIWRKIEEVELFRIKDVAVDQGFFDRILKIGAVRIVSVDQTTPQLSLKGICDPIDVKEKIRKLYRASRKKEQVINMELG